MLARPLARPWVKAFGRAWLASNGRGAPTVLIAPGTMGAASFSRASGATYLDQTGNPPPVTVGTDVARFQGAARRLMVEGARTNLLLNSASLTTQGVTVAAVAQTLSFYGTGTVTLSGASVVGPLVGTGASNRVSLTFTPTAGTLTLTVTGTVSYAQLEAGLTPSSWVPTTGTSAIRAADIPLWVTPSGLDQRGTLLVKSMIPNAAGAANQILLSFDDGTISNRIALRNSANTSDIRATRSIAGAVTNSSTAGNMTPGTVFAAGIGWDTGIISCVGPSMTGINLFTTLPTGLARVQIGNSANLSEPSFGEFDTVIAYPYRMTAAEMVVAVGSL